MFGFCFYSAPALDPRLAVSRLGAYLTALEDGGLSFVRLRSDDRECKHPNDDDDI